MMMMMMMMLMMMMMMMMMMIGEHLACNACPVQKCSINQHVKMEMHEIQLCAPG